MPWLSEAVVVSKAAALAAAAAPYGKNVLQCSQGRNGPRRRQKCADGMSQIVEEIATAAKSGGAQALVLVAVGDCGDASMGAYMQRLSADLPIYTISLDTREKYHTISKYRY